MAGLSTFVGVGLLVLALPVGWHGWRQAGRHDLVDGTPTTEIRQIREPGLVELAGTVHAEDPFESPIGRRECVLAAWTVEEWDESGKHSSWNTVASGVTARPFELDDGTDRVAVDVGTRSSASGLLPDVDEWLGGTGVAVDGVLCEFQALPRVAQHPPDDVPDHVRSFTARHRAVSTPSGSLIDALDFGTQHGERRYYEQVIAPGQDVYLLGAAEPEPEATRPLHPEDVTIRPPGDGELIVSDLPEAQLKRRLERQRLYLPGAVLLAVAGAALVFGLPAWIVPG